MGIMGVSFLLGVSIHSKGVEGDEALLAKLEKKYNKINSFSLNVTKTTYNIADSSVKQTPTVERWSFDFKSPIFFKVHYFSGDDERILLGNEKYIWEYVPKENAVLRTDIRKLPEEVKLRKFVAATRLVHIPFFLVTSELGSFKSAKISIGPAIQNRPTILLAGQLTFANELTNAKISLDKERLNIVKTVLTDDKGNNVLRINYSSPEKIYQDIWFGRKMKYFFKKGLTTEVIFNNISINRDYSKGFFKFKPTKDMKVYKRKAKEEGGKRCKNRSRKH